MNKFDDGQPEELLTLLKKLDITIDGTGTTNPPVQIKYLRTMICVQALREFDELQSQNGSSTNNHINLIKEGLLEYFFLVSSLSNQKRVMRRAMRKP